MNKKLLATMILAAIVALAAGVFALSADNADKSTTSTKQTPAAPANQPQGEVAVEIQMLEDGYVPDKATIKNGQAVRFVNASASDRWPASNLHPSHGLYPEFDPKKAMKPGETWTFTFRKTGQWRMHDHLLPYMKGAITVE